METNEKETGKIKSFLVAHKKGVIVGVAAVVTAVGVIVGTRHFSGAEDVVIEQITA